MFDPPPLTFEHTFWGGQYRFGRGYIHLREQWPDGSGGGAYLSMCFMGTDIERSKYLQIAADFRQAIADGDYTPGSLLPGENDIMQSYGVARNTARRALARLASEGLAVPRQGVGTFVREYQPIIRDSIRRLGAQTWPSGNSVWADEVRASAMHVDQLRKVAETEAPERITVLLGLAEGERVTVRCRRYVLDGKPILRSVSYFPAKLVAGSRITEPDTGPGGVYACLRDLGHSPVSFREDLRARMPKPDEIGDLELVAGTAVVELTRTAFADGGQPVEVSEMVADASAYIFRYDFAVGSRV